VWLLVLRSIMLSANSSNNSSNSSTLWLDPSTRLKVRRSSP
jgi:hypothetical protein